ncbi:hypothetical protein [Devosia sp. Naph2]|uniref:hypothetical protein n=1 Tax=Devosia polycyclovorans TaxID=3345148 RepID=UPI0035CFEF0A
MAASAMDWPWFFPRSAMFLPENASGTGGANLVGGEMIVARPGRWRASVAGPVVCEETVLAWRAFVGAMDGRAGTVLVPKWEQRGIRDADGRELGQIPMANYGNGGLNFDLSGFGQSDIEHATLAADVAAQSTRISLSLAVGQLGPRPGNYIGIGQRLHLVTAAWDDVEDPVLNLQITPWLREDATAGGRVILDRPVCLMRFANTMTGELELDMGRFGSGRLEFVEAI